ncbi:dirigent protein 22-like [Andrographis paniculata]|uniref:dirigent protein 22-like n=1 Tax=Andrographis paniculata TaxID=175694 RepID=UPI0021E94B73|nr:dirigent protein 22-like [Andrographis paniculata]
MAKLYIPLFFTLFFLSSNFAISRAKIENPTKTLPLSNLREKSAVIQFYVHDALSGPNASLWEVGRATITSGSPTSFGLVRVLDDKLTAEPERNAPEVGRGQGIVTSSDFRVVALTMDVNIVFTTGKYNGSTLCLAGRNLVGTKDIELPIVGGTGVFRMARGYAISNAYSFDSVDNYLILDYTMYVYYYG